jgi:hypothetical protein
MMEAMADEEESGGGRNEKLTMDEMVDKRVE